MENQQSRASQDKLSSLLEDLTFFTAVGCFLGLISLAVPHPYSPLTILQVIAFSNLVVSSLYTLFFFVVK